VITEGSVINNRFRLDRLLGRGGFAQVFLCTDTVLGRQVAIKILNPAQGDAEGFDFLGRFQAEARAVAALEHPNLLGIYDYGEVEGTVYLVMPYIDGGTLQDRIAGGRILPLREIANYISQTAEGLDYAHRRGIVHRDIKPQNLLIRAEDNRLLIADFGVAKVMQGDSAHTHTAAIGTVSYMAPEQLQGRAAPSIDIYALGCVLFQLLTGRVPYGGPATQAMLAHMNAPIPSVAERSDGRLPAAFQPLIDRALAKRPEDRFASAGELARSFEALLTNITAPMQPPPSDPQFAAPTQTGGAGTGPRSAPPASLPVVPSTPPAPTVVTPSAPAQPAPRPAPQPAPSFSPPAAASTAAQPDPAAWRRTWLLLIGIGALVVVAIIAVALLINLVRPDAGATATPATSPSPAAATTTTGVGGLTTATATVPGVVTPLSSAAPSVSAQPTLSPTAAASVAPPSAAPSSVPSSAAPSPASSPTATITATRAPTTPPTVAPAAVERGPVLAGHTDDARAIAWPASGDRLITGGSDGTVRFWRTDGTLVNTIVGRTFAVTSVVLSPDGTMLAVGSDDGKVHLWRADGTEVQVFTGHTEPVASVAWAPDSKRLVSGSRDGSVRIWTIGQQEGRVLAGHSDVVLSVAWSSTGLIASASWDRTIRLWNADGTPARTLEGNADQIWAVAWSPDGRTLASGSRDGLLRLWRADGTPLATLPGHTEAISSLAWSPDGATLASGSFDDTARLWSATGQPLGVLTGHTDAVTAVAWGPQPGQLATASWDNTVRLWSVRR
jgi:serine/threonine protein kinase